MIDFKRNNLDKSSSLYLQQHKDNPIHWQEWSKEVVEHARKNGKMIFVSIGYASCHWCHVMAGEAFSNQNIADYLNENFVSIKIDKEQRPDIDKYFMNFLMRISGWGGWPLNVFLNPELNPVYAMTYASLEGDLSRPEFLEILKSVKQFDVNEKFEFVVDKPTDFPENEIVNYLFENFDKTNYGFGFRPKFPPHNALLFMLHYYEQTKNEKVKEMVTKTLDKIEVSGLHDHLQGGFFRYCIDNEWTIPHFEKMLYDQAMLMWVYSLAFKIFRKECYKMVAEKIFKCLKETFLDEDTGLFYSGIDADTNHIEGKTYVWNSKELRKFGAEKFYGVANNFEGGVHLIRNKEKNSKELDDLNEKLLAFRKIREQPAVDRKFVTSWNCFVGIGLMNAYVALGDKKYLDAAERLLDGLIENHLVKDKLAHSSFNGVKVNKEFLEDYAAMLLFVSYLCEAKNGKEYEKLLKDFYKIVKGFYKNEKWIEADNADFVLIYADYFDHPIPSSVSLAEFAILKSDVLLGKKTKDDKNFKDPLNHAFFDVSVLMRKNLKS